MPAPSVPEGDAPDDIGAALESNWDKAADTGDSPPPVEGDPSASAPTDPADSPSPEPASADAGRVRDPQTGKFVKADPKLQAQAQAQGSDFRIPDKWPAPVKEKLAAIHAVNPEHAQFVLEQYAHFRNEAAQHANRVNSTLKQFDDLLAPGRQQRALKNVDDTTYVRNLIAAGDFLDKNPVEGLKYLAQNYGIDLQKLVNPEAGGEPEIPPYVQQLQQENAQIKAFLASQVQGQSQQQLEQASGWIDSFASQKDANGQPLYPHFDEVLNELIVNVQYQMQSGQPVDVHAAYTRAVRMNDSVWLKEQAARSEASKKEAEARRRREIEDAKRAGFSVSGSGAASSAQVPDDLGEALSRNYDRFSS